MEASTLLIMMDCTNPQRYSLPLTREDAVVFVYGEMMLEYWTLDTPHAIYLTEGKGYEFAEGRRGCKRKSRLGLLLENRLIAELDKQDLSS
jgi:hypothetical protein